MMIFKEIYPALYKSARILYDILAERKPRECIRHKTLPSWEEHMKFVLSEPYYKWYIIYEDEEPIGHINLTLDRKVGVFLFERFRGKGLGEEAIRRLVGLHPGPLYAEVNPLNAPSIVFFTRLGGKLVQHTYEVIL